MRIKKDLIIKYYQSRHLATLSFEEMGALLILLLKEQDTDGLRFEKMGTYTIQSIKDNEADAEKLRRELPPNRRAIFETAFDTINGQAEYSKAAFLRLQKSYEGKDDRTETESRIKSILENVKTIDRTYTLNFSEGITEKFVARALKENEINLPSEKRLQEIVDEIDLGYFEMLDIFEKANTDEWNKDIEKYMEWKNDLEKYKT